MKPDSWSFLPLMTRRSVLRAGVALTTLALTPGVHAGTTARRQGHSGGRCQINISRNRGIGYNTPVFLNNCYHASWSIIDQSSQGLPPLAGLHIYVNQETGALKRPPVAPGADWRWKTGQLRLWGDNGQRWVLTWEGAAEPDLVLVDPYSNAQTETLTLVSWKRGRKVYQLDGLVPLPATIGSDGQSAASAPTNGKSWEGFTGEMGWSILSQITINMHQGEVSNLRLCRLEDEPALLAGEIYTPEFLGWVDGWGVIRWMDEFGSNGDPNAAQWTQYNGNTVKWLDYSHRDDGLNVEATAISENYFDVPTVAAYPSGPVDRMALRIMLPPWRLARCRVFRSGATSPSGTVPAGLTYIEWASHGFSNGELIQRAPYYWSDNPNGENGGLSILNDSTLDAETGLRAVYAVTVISTDIISIAVDTASAPLASGESALHFMRPVRIRYGGQTFYVHDGGGRFFETVEDDWETGSGALTQSFRTLDTASGAVTGSILYVVLVQPYGQPISKAYFNRGTGRGSRLADPRELVDICNRAGAHCWLHIPPFASDDLIDRFATAVRDRLAPGIEAWFELGNELWNNSRRTFPWPAHFQHLADVSGHDFSGWPARQLLGHFIGNMARRVRAVFAGSGKTCRFVINCQLGAGTMEENDFYCTGLGGYAPGDAPGDLVDYLAWAPYSCHPAYHDGDGTTEDGAFYVRALAAFRAGDKATAFDIMRDMRTHHLLEGYYGRIFGNGPHERLRLKWNKLNVMYEGGFHHFASYGAYRSVQRANGFTDYEARNLFWQYRRSDQYAEVVRTVFGKWLSDPTKLYPSHYVLIDSWQTEASFALGNWNSPFAASDIAPPFSAFRELNSPA